jgi:hypothetical protein
MRFFLLCLSHVSWCVYPNKTWRWKRIVKRATAQPSAASCFCITLDPRNFIRNSKQIFLLSFLLLLIFVYVVNILVVHLQQLLLLSYVYILYYVRIAVLYFIIAVCTSIAICILDVGLLARSQYSEGPATGHLGTGFSWFPCVHKRMLRWFPRFQVATTCFSCSPPDLNVNFLVISFIYLYTCKITTATGWQPNCS